MLQVTFAGLVQVLTLGMGAVVVAFASRSLRDEPYRRRFLLLGTLLALVASVLVSTPSAVVLTVAWIATGRLAVALVRLGPAAGRTARTLRMNRALLASDVALLAAVGILTSVTGSTSVDAAAELDGSAAALVGLLVLTAAAARGSTLPFHRWLPDTTGAPTPSSALLHAGVVNGGAILLIRLADVVATVPVVAAATVALGAISCVLAELIMLQRPDVKGRLAWSTVAQMSFTLMLCGVGFTTAAGLHLVGHGLYKGALFLGSGSAVRPIVRHRDVAAIRAPSAWLSGALAFGATGLAVIATARALDPAPSAELALTLGLGWITAGTATAAWWRHTDTRRHRSWGVTAGAGLVAAFTLFTILLKDQIAREISVAAPALAPAVIVPLLLTLGAVALVPLPRIDAWARRAGRPVAARLIPRPSLTLEVPHGQPRSAPALR